MFVTEKKKEILNVHDVADLLDLSEQTVRDMARQGELPGFRAGLNRWRFRRSDIDKYIDEQINQNRKS
jgi:excisionase family DNA binding protein